MTRRSISRELFEERPVTRAKPVARRSVSRELFDVNFVPGGGGVRPRKDVPDLDSIRRQMRERERSMSREFDAYCMDKGFSTNFAAEPDDGGVLGGGGVDGQDMEDPFVGPASRQAWGRGGGGAMMMMDMRDPSYGGSMKRPTAHLASHGRSLTQNDFQLPSSRLERAAARRFREEGDYGGGMYGGGPGGGGGGRRYDAAMAMGGGGGGGGSLDTRDSWRRVSVPERGQDFKSLPRKYNRLVGILGY